MPFWEEDVQVTKPILPGQCVSVTKETRGLMVRLHFEHMTTVRDPWATPLLLRGTRVPVWPLEWVPTQYLKEWPICNQNGAIVAMEPVTSLKPDTSLNFFWKLYPAASGSSGKSNPGRRL